MHGNAPFRSMQRVLTERMAEDHGMRHCSHIAGKSLVHKSILARIGHVRTVLRQLRGFDLLQQQLVRTLQR